MTVPRVDALDIPAAVAALEKSGAVILTNFTSVSDVDQANADLKQQLKLVEDQPIDFFPDRVQTCYSTFVKSKTIREQWALHSSYQAILDHFLTSQSSPWQGNNFDQIVSRPILSTSISVNVLPGAKAQLLHRDDMTWHRELPDRSGGYTSELEHSIGLLVPGTRFFKENGGTLVVPGSHLWPHNKRATPEQTVCCVMDKGDALIALGSLGHGAGSNITDTERILHSVFMCRSWLKPENCVYPLVTAADLRGWSLEAQRIAGFKKGDLFIGHTEGTDPLAVIYSREQV